MHRRLERFSRLKAYLSILKQTHLTDPHALKKPDEVDKKNGSNISIAVFISRLPFLD